MNSILWYFINLPLKMTPYEPEYFGRGKRKEKPGNLLYVE
jgi:hypothetical protein